MSDWKVVTLRLVAWLCYLVGLRGISQGRTFIGSYRLEPSKTATPLVSDEIPLSFSVSGFGSKGKTVMPLSISNFESKGSIGMSFSFSSFESKGSMIMSELSGPTMQPTLPVPTMQPTLPVPTMQPTLPVLTMQPTQPVPTIQPTLPVPTIQPTQPVPTIQPTPPLSSSYSFSYSFSGSIDVVTMPSPASTPTPVPTLTPAVEPTFVPSVQTTPIIQFAANISISGFDAPEVVGGSDVAVAASAAVVMNIPPDAVTPTTITVSEADSSTSNEPEDDNNNSSNNNRNSYRGTGLLGTPVAIASKHIIDDAWQTINAYLFQLQRLLLLQTVKYPQPQLQPPPQAQLQQTLQQRHSKHLLFATAPQLHAQQDKSSGIQLGYAPYAMKYTHRSSYHSEKQRSLQDNANLTTFIITYGIDVEVALIGSGFDSSNDLYSALSSALANSTDSDTGDFLTILLQEADALGVELPDDLEIQAIVIGDFLLLLPPEEDDDGGTGSGGKSSSGSGGSGLDGGVLIGIIIGALLLLVLVGIIVVFCVTCRRSKINRQSAVAAVSIEQMNKHDRQGKYAAEAEGIEGIEEGYSKPLAPTAPTGETTAGAAGAAPLNSQALSLPANEYVDKEPVYDELLDSPLALTITTNKIKPSAASPDSNSSASASGAGAGVRGGFISQLLRANSSSGTSPAQHRPFGASPAAAAAGASPPMSPSPPASTSPTSSPNSRYKKKTLISALPSALRTSARFLQGASSSTKGNSAAIMTADDDVPDPGMLQRQPSSALQETIHIGGFDTDDWFSNAVPPPSAGGGDGSQQDPSHTPELAAALVRFEDTHDEVAELALAEDDYAMEYAL